LSTAANRPPCFILQAWRLSNAQFGNRRRVSDSCAILSAFEDSIRESRSAIGGVSQESDDWALLSRSKRVDTRGEAFARSRSRTREGSPLDVKRAIAKILKKEGTEFLIGYPVNNVIEASAEEDIRTIIVRQERTGIHMADAVSRMTSGERIGVFTMQHGPGTENSFGGVAQAFGDSSPIVVLPGGYPREVAGVPPHFSSALNYRHVTKSAELLLDPSHVTDVMRRAFSNVRNGRPRPVLVELPVDLLPQEVDDPVDYRPAVRYRSAPDPAAAAEVARTLVEAENPVLYAGQGVHYAKAWSQLKALAELLEAPVTTSLQGKSAFPEDHRLSLGSGGRSMPKPVHHFLQKSDVIFGIGCSFATTNYGIKFPKGKTMIHATADPADLNQYIEADYALIGDAALTLEAVTAEASRLLDGKTRGRADAIADEIAAVRQEWLDEWMPKLASEETPLSPYRVIWDLLHTVDVANTVITHDAGSPRDQLSPFWRTTDPLTYLGWGKTTQLGYGLGLAMGAKLVAPEKLCINVWGDAAIGFTGMDFETAVRERIPIMSVLLNNFSMAIELPIMQVATEKYRSTDISGHYADFAKALGGYGERVTDPSEIVPAIKRGIQKTQEGTPVLLEFITQKEIQTSTFPS
jgi:thiamine pyrophosphate-dependent acetolactate synthase large subunit-like protein